MIIIYGCCSYIHKIRGEINYYLVNKPQDVSLTNLADFHWGKRDQGDSVWLEVRKRRQY
jgi:hypothetical protein